MRRTRPALPLNRKLILNRWLLGLFGCERFEDLAKHLRDEELEGLDDDGVHRFHKAIRLHLPAARRPELPDDLLLRYDHAVTSITHRLNEARAVAGKPPVAWKYFQYLALLFTEVYLDRYFAEPEALLARLNNSVQEFNAGEPARDHVPAFELDSDARPQLNKVAFWMATGSGKTLLMHANILQYRRLLEEHGRTRTLNRIILLTPNEGLSRQHLDEFAMAGISAEIFSKESGGVLSGRMVEILDIHKLKEKEGPKTVAAEAFEGENLVLVDEGHRGASSGNRGAWMRFRNQLCEHGFSFEYSATFGQAVKGNRNLAAVYARGTLFDYSYRWFYGDGFGKDYRIFNLEQDRNEAWRSSYLTACLLTFFQQQRLYGKRRSALRAFNLERPLWIFVGGRVTKGFSTVEASDIADILRFLKNYVSDRQASQRRIRRLLAQGLDTTGGKSLFDGHFGPLNAAGLSARAVYDETLKLVFNAPGRGSLRIERLTGGADGELAVRLGDNPPFGVINVGDSRKLARHCLANGLNAVDREFSDSLFHDINRHDSRINLLVGAKKFTEGWNSWRVSTMGLMNVGKSEGAQIIQLFGRGVRLKGKGMCLKRSSAVSENDDALVGLHHLETLEVFGVKAKYMAQFRDFLREEELPFDRTEMVLPVIPRDLPDHGLKTIRLAEAVASVSGSPGAAYRQLGPAPCLSAPADSDLDESVRRKLRRHRVVLDWYPKIRALRSEEGADSGAVQPQEGCLEQKHVDLLDLEALFLHLQRFKSERGWNNLTVSRTAIRDLLRDESWYSLRIPDSELRFDDYSKVRRWQEIALALLKKYMERYYKICQGQWESKHLEYSDLTSGDANFPVVSGGGGEHGYRILIDGPAHDPKAVEIAAKLGELARTVRRGDRFWEFGEIKAMSFDQHLYRPLLFAGEQSVAVSPTPLNEGEWQFVRDLRDYLGQDPGTLRGTRVYLMRNMSRGHGIGFFEAANFHPDFILWAVSGSRQRIAFVDPKGLRYVGPHHPKVRFHQTIKRIQDRLGSPDVTLESFIVSNTPFHAVKDLWGMDRAELESRHVYFQEDGKAYIRAILDKMGAAGPFGRPCTGRQPC